MKHTRCLLQWKREANCAGAMNNPKVADMSRGFLSEPRNQSSPFALCNSCKSCNSREFQNRLARLARVTQACNAANAHSVANIPQVRRQRVEAVESFLIARR